MNDEVKVYSSATLVSAATVMTGETLVANGNDSMYVSSGGTANSTTVNIAGSMFVTNGGVANTTGVHWGGHMYISNGGVANVTCVTSSGSMSVSSGGVANRTSVWGKRDWLGLEYGNLTVFSGGMTNDTTVDTYGKLIVSNGGSANKTFVFGLLGEVDVCGGTVDGTELGSGGVMYVSYGGMANNTAIYDRGAMHVSYGMVNGATVYNGGGMYISSGGTALAVKENGGYVAVHPGACVTFLSNSFSGLELTGAASLHSKTTAYDTSIKSLGSMFIYGGTANGTTVNEGSMCIECDGIANNTVVNSKGRVFISSGGTANGVTVSKGGWMIVSSGGTVSGTLRLSSSTAISAYQGAVIDFTVAKQTEPSSALIDNWNLINGGNDADYTVTVNAKQMLKTYILADGAADFAQTVTVKTTAEDILGTLAAGETKEFGSRDYTLTKDAGLLTLTIASEVITPAVSDYNGSGRSDMIQFVNGLVYVTHDTDSGYVQTPAINDITGWNVVEIRRDLTGDGFADIQITSDDGYGSTWVATLRNDYLVNGCITLNYQFIGAYDNQLWSYLGSADFNADGKSEILMIQTDAGKDPYGHRNVAAWVTDSTTCEWIDNIWLGSLNDEWDVAGTADVTGDGADNVLLRRSDGLIGYWSEAGTNNIVELKNAGDRVLLTTGDFDGDGASDFLWKSLNGDEISVWTDLIGTFSDETIGKISDLGGNWSFAGVGDYNGDGMDELLWCDTTTYQTAYSEGNKENFAKLTVIV